MTKPGFVCSVVVLRRLLFPASAFPAPAHGQSSFAFMRFHFIESTLYWLGFAFHRPGMLHPTPSSFFCWYIFRHDPFLNFAISPAWFSPGRSLWSVCGRAPPIAKFPGIHVCSPTSVLLIRLFCSDRPRLCVFILQSVARGSWAGCLCAGGGCGCVVGLIEAAAGGV